MPVSSSYVQYSGQELRLGNRHIELGFCPQRHGALVSILDKPTGCQLRRDPEASAPLWRLALRRQDTREIVWLDSDQAGRFTWTQAEERGTVTLSLVAAGFTPHDVTVTVRVSLTPDSSLSAWRLEVRGLGRDVALHRLMCPIVSGLARLGDPAPGESLAVPLQGEGYLFRNPFPVRDRLPLCAGPGPETADVGLGRVGGRYPGSLSLQMYAWYNDRAGLYFAAHDSGQHVKEFEMGPWPHGGPAPVLSMSHFPGEVPGGDVTIPYDCIVGVFHGDWYDAADIYRAWATLQWWCRQKLQDRDIAPWMRTGVGGVFQMSNYDIPVLKLNHPMHQIAEVVNDLSRQAGVPLLGLVFNWEAGGAWTGPKGFFPPREGETAFRQAMASLRQAGNYGFVYMPGGQWYIKIPYDPPFDSWPAFEAEGRPHAVKRPDGQVDLHVWTGYGGWESARLCPQADYTLELTASIVCGCLALGCTVVQIDNFPCGSSEACYDLTHGHPPGHGPWWSQAWARILAEVRRRAKAQDPLCALATEGISENFIPYLDFYDHRAGNMEYFGHYSRGLPAGGETIPLFNYVYNEYIGSYCAAYPECNRPEVLYWTRCLGKALTQGVLPAGGRYFPQPPEHNPVTIAFYRKVVRAAARECWPYIMFGRMLRPPKIDVPEVTAQYCKFYYDGKAHLADPRQRHEVRDRAVQQGTFRGPDGSIGHLFVNIAEEPVSFDVELPTYGDEASAFDIERIVDGQRQPPIGPVALPHQVRIDMAPLSILVMVVRAH